MNYFSMKKNIKKIVSFICAVMMAASVSSVFADEYVEPTDFGTNYGIVNVDSVNVREYSNIESPVIEKLSKYTYVNVMWLEPEWAAVSLEDGRIGYISLEYVDVFEGAMPEFSAGGQAAVEIAKQFLGVPYVWGGTSPSGFDCSGLMQYVYRQLGYNINRVAEDQMRNGIPVSREQLQPGDLVGFYSSPGSGYISHIGMYVGNGEMIHAPHTGDVVKFTSIDGSYYSARFAGGRRIVY